jgi:hypothetical protein
MDSDGTEDAVGHADFGDPGRAAILGPRGHADPGGDRLVRENGFLVVERITTDEEIDWLRPVFEAAFEEPDGKMAPQATKKASHQKADLSRPSARRPLTQFAESGRLTQEPAARDDQADLCGRLGCGGEPVGGLNSQTSSPPERCGG